MRSTQCSTERKVNINENHMNKEALIANFKQQLNLKGLQDNDQSQKHWNKKKIKNLKFSYHNNEVGNNT